MGFLNNIGDAGRVLFGAGLKSDMKLANASAAKDIGDIYVSPSLKDQGIFKAYIPRFLYKPPFGYPRSDNVPLMRQLSRNGYVFAVHQTIYEEVAMADYDVVFKEESEKKEDPKLEETRKSILKFFRNPNRNKESFAQLRQAATIDLLETDSAVWVKVFNFRKEFSQLFARDGASFLKNFDIYGYSGDKDEFIDPMQYSWFQQQYGRNAQHQETIKQYSINFAQKAAYFQYGTSVSASIPVPFGRREVVYMQRQFRSDEPYGRSPIAMLSDIITTLVYGSNYNLDFYMNSNMPEGVLQVLGANSKEIKAFRARFNRQFIRTDENTGFARRIAYRIPISTHEVKFTPFQLDPKTMQILEQQEWFYKLVLACYGVPPHAIGLEGSEGLRTGDGDNQLKYYLRKSARPILGLFKDRIDMEIIPEWGPEAYEHLEFKWLNYDINEEKKRFDLHEQQIRMGIKTPRMVAEEEGINYSEVEKYQEEQQKKQMQLSQEQGQEFAEQENATAGNPATEGSEKPGLIMEILKKKQSAPEAEGEKSSKLGIPQSELEEELRSQISEQGKKILKALEEVQ